MNEEIYPTDENESMHEELQAEEQSQAPTHEPPPSDQPVTSRRSPWPWVGLGVLALLVVVVIVVFALDLPGRLTGKLDAAAVAMPADTTIYMGVNLLQLTPAKLDRIVKPFTAEVSEVEFKDTASMLAELDKSLEDSYGFNFTGDIQPWVGQYLGFGIAGDFMRTSGFDPEEAGFILAIEVRDRKAADAFLDKLRSSLVEKSDQRVNEQEYQGVTIYTHEANQVAFARSKSLVLFAPRLEDVQAAIDAQRGDSLNDNADFKTLGRQLPGERFLTVFANSEQYLQMLSEGTPSAIGITGLQMTTQMQAVGSIAASLAIVDEGLRVDAIASYDAEKLSETQRTMMQNASKAGLVAEVMPADTMFLFAGQGLNNIMQMYEEVLGEQMGVDYDEAMQMLEAELGFNPGTDLLAYLEGEYGLAIVSEPNNLLAQTAGVPLGIIFVSRISDHDMLESTIQNFNRFASGQGVTVKESNIGEDHIYTLGDPFMGEVVSLGLSQDHLAISLTRQGIENVFDPGETLMENSDYQEIWTHFSKDSVPVFYLKLPELLESLRGSMVGQELESFDESTAFLKPVSFIAMASSPLKDDQLRSTLTVFIEKAE